MSKYLLTMDVWPELQKLLNLPGMAISGGVTIHLKQGDVVRVDAMGILPLKQPVEVTTLEAPIAEYVDANSP